LRAQYSLKSGKFQPADCANILIYIRWVS